MSGNLKRYVIRFPSGLYSHGPSLKPVALNKAKFWKQINHVKCHLQGVPTKGYPPGTEVVEVELVPQETGNKWSVQSVKEESNLRRDLRVAQSNLMYSERELEHASKAADRLHKTKKKIRDTKERIDNLKEELKKRKP